MDEKTMSAVGDRNYVAPEVEDYVRLKRQYRDKPKDLFLNHKCDIYSLGKVFYQAFNLRLPDKELFRNPQKLKFDEGIPNYMVDLIK